MAQRDQGMRMLINDEEDEEDDDDDNDGDDGDDGDKEEEDDDDDDDGDGDVDAADDEDEEDEEGEDEDENEDDDHPLPAGNLLSGGLGGDQGGSNLGPAGGVNWKVSRFPMVLLPAYSFLKQEQLQLAQLAFVTC